MESTEFIGSEAVLLIIVLTGRWVTYYWGIHEISSWVHQARSIPIDRYLKCPWQAVIIYFSRLPLFAVLWPVMVLIGMLVIRLILNFDAFENGKLDRGFAVLAIYSAIAVVSLLLDRWLTKKIRKRHDVPENWRKLFK